MGLHIRLNESFPKNKKKRRFEVTSSLPPVVCRRARVLFTLCVSVEGLVSYLRYLCLFAYSGVQHILCCVFVLFFFVLCKPGLNSRARRG
jgi:hypothetical protein